MNFNRNMSTEKYRGDIPKLSDISDRFYDINGVISVEIDYRGYLPEIQGYAPFKGLTTIHKLINILNRDINVIVKDAELLKLRNSIIYYNEYFCPSEQNENGAIPALMAFERIESKYNRLCGNIEIDTDDKNPFLNNVLKGVCSEYEHTKTNIDEAMDRYILERKKEQIKLKSGKGIVQQQTQETRQTMHSLFCTNMYTSIDLENYEKCFEDCEYLEP